MINISNMIDNVKILILIEKGLNQLILIQKKCKENLIGCFQMVLGR
jgi:hypothetical protein